MRRAVIAFVLSTGLIAAGAPQAAAFVPGPTPSHDQFIAQLDSICQPFARPVNDAFSAYDGNFKQMIRLAKRVNRVGKSGNAKALKKSVRAFLRATRSTAGSLNALAQVHTDLIGQINTVTPPPEGWFFEWFSHLGDEKSAELSAATALLQLKIKQFSAALKQADGAEAAAQQAISGVGFHVCGVSVY